MIENSATVAKFMWGEGNIVPSIDEMNDMFMKEKLSYSSCGIRFSIGAIYFSKQTWKDMGMFKPAKGTALGLDELQLCEYCISFSKAIIVSENTVVGHLSFGRQNAEMKDYYLSNIKVKSNITN